MIFFIKLALSIGYSRRKLCCFTREFYAFTREFRTFTRELSCFTREFHFYS
ncbi:hypothetical protein [Peribacillus simplex]|uniref:hypothetical protein n=1 Tax=Peribacillus simplex TaxID=1478 RepID=UPI003CF97DCB